MTTVLKNVLNFSGLVVGVPKSLPHLLNVAGMAVAPSGVAVIPDLVATNASGYTLAADTVNVTVTRTTGPASVGVYVEHWHTIEDSEPPGGASLPFFIQGGGGSSSSPPSTDPMFLPGVWTATSIPASANQDLVVAPNQLGVVMQRPGSIIGISFQLVGLFSVGSLTVEVTKNGTPGTLVLTLAAAAGTLIASLTQASGIDTYVAGDLIGIHLLTSANFAKANFDSIAAFLEGIESP